MKAHSALLKTGEEEGEEGGGREMEINIDCDRQQSTLRLHHSDLSSSVGS